MDTSLTTATYLIYEGYLMANGYLYLVTGGYLIYEGYLMANGYLVTGGYLIMRAT